MSRALYLHEPINEHVVLDRHHLRINLPGTRFADTNANIRYLVERLVNTDVLLLPDATHRWNRTIETVKQVALYMGVEVIPMRAYTAKQKIHPPATVCAEPPTQHATVCGQIIAARS